MATIRQAINEAVERGNTCFYSSFIIFVIIVVVVIVVVVAVIAICFKTVYFPTVN